MQENQVVDEVVSITEGRAASFQQRIDKMNRMMDAYMKIAADKEKLRKELKVIVGWGNMQEEQGIERGEFVRQINSVLTALFADPITGQPKIPLSFWQTTLGQLINRGHLRFIAPYERMFNPTDAAREAGVSRETVYRWAELARFFPVWIGDHPFILERDLQSIVTGMNRKAHSFSEEATIEDGATPAL